MDTARSSRLQSLLARPGYGLAVAKALFVGRWYRLWNRLLGRRLSAGRNFRVHGRLVLRGPGRVSFGNDVVLYGTVTPWTHSPEAHIQIGDNTVMESVRLGCAQSISIGRWCIVAESIIEDTDFHSTRADRRTNPDAPIRTVPVVIEDNAWVGGQAGLLPGTHIGRNSVVGFGSICNRRYPENVILFGNPARVVAPVVKGTTGDGENLPGPSVASEATSHESGSHQVKATEKGDG